MLRRALVCLLCFVAPSAYAQSASTWFLAEGASNANYDEDILVGNPSSSPLTVTVTLLPAPDAQVTGPTQRTFSLPATGRLTVRLKRDFPGLNGAASAQVSAVVQGTATPADIVVERTMFFPAAPAPYVGGTGASGVTTPAVKWYLPEGSGERDFQTFVLLANPSGTAATVSLRYLRNDGVTVPETITVAAGQRQTLWPSTYPELAGRAFSTVVESTVPVVAERAMYFDSFRSGHDALGLTAPGTTWYFAEGFTGIGGSSAFDTFFLLSNDNDQAAEVTATYYLNSGAPIEIHHTVPARSRYNIWADLEQDGSGALVLGNHAFSTRITSTVPIVAERAVYWGPPSAADPYRSDVWSEGHVVGGIEAPHSKWAFAEGRQGADDTGETFDSFFLVVNPNANAINVRATFVTEDGTGVTTIESIPGNTRQNIWPIDDGSPNGAKYRLLDGRRFAVFLESVGGEPFVAERAMYWRDFVGGHANGGTPWTGTVATPASEPANVTITGMTPMSGRLSGGEVVTITGGPFGNDTKVFLAGVEVPLASRTTNEIKFTMPLRSRETGFGTPGPVSIALISHTRFVKAPPFTRYFTVLAFGDSITFGITNVFDIGGQRVTLQVPRPYPLGVRNWLRNDPQFGPYTLVTNAGVPGEQVVFGTPSGEVRFDRCRLGQDNCVQETANPQDYLAPHDVAVIFEGVNDLNWGTTPLRISDSIRVMAQKAKAQGLGVVLSRLDSYGYNEWNGNEPAVDFAKNNELGNLVYNVVASEVGTWRVNFGTNIDMCPDGLHPTQIGYDRMAQIVFDKLKAEFPRCPNGGSCP